MPEYAHIYILSKKLKNKVKKLRPEGMTLAKWNETVIEAGLSALSQESNADEIAGK